MKLNVPCLSREAAGVGSLFATLLRAKEYLAVAINSFHESTLRDIVEVRVLLGLVAYPQVFGYVLRNLLEVNVELETDIDELLLCALGGPAVNGRKPVSLKLLEGLWLFDTNLLPHIRSSLQWVSSSSSITIGSVWWFDSREPRRQEAQACTSIRLRSSIGT